MAEDVEDHEPRVIRLAEETAVVTKRLIAEGRVEVRTSTESFDETVGADLLREGVVVTRVAIGTEVTVAPQVRIEGDVTIVPVLEEILVIEKRLVLKEEIHIRRTSETNRFESNVTLRRQRAVVERTGASGRTRSGRISKPGKETT